MPLHEFIENGTGSGNASPPGNASIISTPPSFYVVKPLLFLDIVVSLGNILLLILLLYVYWDNYRKIKSSFTLGLIIFAGLLLLQNILFTSFLLFHPAFQVSDLGVPLFILNITEFLALAILLVVTWK